MTTDTPLTQESKSEWRQITPGERFVVRIPSEDTKGAYTTLEVAADHRNGVRMHIHENERTRRVRGSNLGRRRRHGVHRR